MVKAYQGMGMTLKQVLTIAGSDPDGKKGR